MDMALQSLSATLLLGIAGETSLLSCIRIYITHIQTHTYEYAMTCMQVSDDCTTALERMDFSAAGRQSYDFFWSQFADWYVEAAKTRLYSDDSQRASAARQVRASLLCHPNRSSRISQETWSDCKRACAVSLSAIRIAPLASSRTLISMRSDAVFA